MKLKIGNKHFNVIIGLNKLSPHITCKVNTVGDDQIVIHFYVRRYGQNFWIHQLQYKIYITNNNFDITNFNVDVACFYKNLKSNLKSQSFTNEECEIIINSIIDKRVQILL